MITLAPPDRRGRLMERYTTAISGSFHVGIAAFVACGLISGAVLPRLPRPGAVKNLAGVQALPLGLALLCLALAIFGPLRRRHA